MSSSSSVKEFVLITRDEYTSLLATKQHIQNNFLTASPHNQCTSLVQQQQFSPTHLTPSKNGSILDFDLKTNKNIAAGTSAAVAELNLQTRFEANKKKRAESKDTPPFSFSSSNEHNDGADGGRNNSADVIFELLACRLSAGKMERARQILRKIQFSDSVTIDSNSGRLHLYDRDTGLTIFALLSDLQVPTKRLSEGCLDLVRQLRLPEYIMANTNAKQVANDMERSAPDETTTDQYKWFKMY